MLTFRRTGFCVNGSSGWSGPGPFNQRRGDRSNSVLEQVTELYFFLNAILLRVIVLGTFGVFILAVLTVMIMNCLLRKYRHTQKEGQKPLKRPEPIFLFSFPSSKMEEESLGGFKIIVRTNTATRRTRGNRNAIDYLAHWGHALVRSARENRGGHMARRLSFVPPRSSSPFSYTMTTNSMSNSASILNDCRIKPGICKIQNFFGQTYLEIREHSKELCCRLAAALEDGKGLVSLDYCRSPPRQFKSRQWISHDTSPDQPRRRNERGQD